MGPWKLIFEPWRLSLELVRLNPEVWRFRIQLVIMEAHPRAMESSSRTIAADS
jgi:hypothetical protein